MPDVCFSSIRSDWYAANTLLPRLIVKAVLGHDPLRLLGFPSHWIPVAVHYGLESADWQSPGSYVSIFSELAPDQVLELATKALVHGTSRSLLVQRCP